ncbi:pyridoxamine 5'-phosphate oxidase family protein [Candidatus Binatus sp.]|uniref:pyridoxamine 5'-phosphate oxidase family protein n=1 Tax=Candidatus Binatus sp. TaxID=2811406 RepID=UPI003CC5EF3D
MSELYSTAHRALQQTFDTTRLADRLEAMARPELAGDQKAFVESRDMFFLTSIDHRGYPTCSYKGGAPGFVRVPTPTTIVFPSYNGNGMYLSMGNINTSRKVGMLFIDFETPNRVRVHGVATIDRNDPMLAEFIGAEILVRVAVTEAFVNCPRYIHKYQRLQTSKYAPQAGSAAPPAPQWKRIDAIQDSLPAHARGIAKSLGGTITLEEYGALVGKREG